MSHPAELRAGVAQKFTGVVLVFRIKMLGRWQELLTLQWFSFNEVTIFFFYNVVQAISLPALI